MKDISADELLRRTRKALSECQDFISAIADATQGCGRIDENSRMIPGERLKTSAKRLDKVARAALALSEPKAKGQQ